MLLDRLAWATLSLLSTVRAVLFSVRVMPPPPMFAQRRLRNARAQVAAAGERHNGERLWEDRERDMQTHRGGAVWERAAAAEQEERRSRALGRRLRVLGLATNTRGVRAQGHGQGGD